MKFKKMLASPLDKIKPDFTGRHNRPTLEYLAVKTRTYENTQDTGACTPSDIKTKTNL